MTREEQIEQAAKKYVKDIVTPLPASLMTAFIKGAEYADRTPIHYDGKAMLHVLNKGHEQGYNDAIDKACEWLNANYAEIYLLARGGVSSDKVVKQFKKYMEENK